MAYSERDGRLRPPYLFRAKQPTLFEVYQHEQGYYYDDIDYMFSVLRRPLPITFRVRTRELALPTSLPRKALPGVEGAFQCPATLPYDARKWLASHTKAGDISRQEFVSMLPVKLLSIEPHHAVLDMCASPGSKTMQAVDALFAGELPPTGYVIANEMNPRRAHILAHRCRTLHDRQKSLAIVCHNAAKFPNVLAPLVSTGVPSESPFDRIICDVPCSGDGTLRKDIKVWKKWHPSYGIDLHSLQVRIAKRE